MHDLQSNNKCAGRYLYAALKIESKSNNLINIM